MAHRQLGDSGFRVPVIGLGGTTFGKHVWFTNFCDQASSVEIIRRAADMGANFVDTANMYSGGVSETYSRKRDRRPST